MWTLVAALRRPSPARGRLDGDIFASPLSLGPFFPPQPASSSERGENRQQRQPRDRCLRMPRHSHLAAGSARMGSIGGRGGGRHPSPRRRRGRPRRGGRDVSAAVRRRARAARDARSTRASTRRPAGRRRPGRAPRRARPGDAGREVPRPPRARACTTWRSRSSDVEGELERLAAGGAELIDEKPRRGCWGSRSRSSTRTRPAACSRSWWPVAEGDRTRLEIAFRDGQALTVFVSPETADALEGALGDGLARSGHIRGRGRPLHRRRCG